MPHDFGALAALATSFAKIKTIKWVVNEEEVKTFEDAKRLAGPPEGNKSVQDVAASGRLPCLFGIDYGQPCPTGWVESGRICQPPRDYTFSPRCLQLTEGKAFISPYLNQDQKRSIELACSVGWPCADETVGLVPNYDQMCPVHWYSQPDGSCKADPSYDGPCKTTQNFLMFTPGMKATWAANCGTSWPLEPAKEPEIPGPPPPPSDPSQAVWARCRHDYRHPCPMTFSLDGNGVCQGREHHESKGVRLCDSADTSRWTAEMKQAYEKNCFVAWPCVGEVHLASSAILLGLMFL